MIEKVFQIASFRNILQEFPQSMKFCFAYGSGAFKQKSDSASNMLDLIFVVQNPSQWHAENMDKNPSHYAQPLRLLGNKAVSKVQESFGASVYYNTLVTTSEGRSIKYGIISEISLIKDLLDWNVLYLAGRLHKPVQILHKPDEKSLIKTSLVQNLHSAVRAALLLLPEDFTEIKFYKTIAGLSYNGDFRMIFGEDKDKVNNIVVPQLPKFRALYTPILKILDPYIDIPKGGDGFQNCRQDPSPESRIDHLNQLPRVPQVQIVRKMTLGPKSKDTEDCLRALAHNPDIGEILKRCLRDIVWHSSVTQSLKGIVTAGIGKSVMYSAAKIKKMIKSSESLKKLPLAMFMHETKKSNSLANTPAPCAKATKNSEKPVKQ